MIFIKFRYLIPIVISAVTLLGCSGSGNNNPNTAPVADAQAVTTNEDTPLALTLSGSDADGDTLTYSVTSPPTHGSLSGTAPNLTYTPAANYHGGDAFSFTVNDGTTSSTAADIDITIQAVNDAPVATGASETSYPGETVTGTLQASDQEGDTLIFSIVSQGTKGVAVINDINTGDYAYSPSAGAIDTDSFTFKANDGLLDSNIATVTITDIAPSTPTAGLGASAGDQRVTVNWDPVAGADSYTVYWSDTPGTGTGGTAITGIKAPPFYHDGRANDTTYYYVVVAVNSAGASGASAEVSAAPVDIALSGLSFSDTNLASCVSSASSGKTYVHELTTLGSSCTSKGITDITGIEALTSLTNLNLGVNSIVDISPIQGLTQLTVLSLSGNSISDVRPLSRITGLTQLTLNNNSLTSISGLEDMTNMLTLYLYNNSINDLTPLSGMTAMTELRIYVNNISNISPLSSCTSLVTLMLDDNTISDLTPLSGITSLQYLYLARNSIVDVSPLASLAGLKVVSLLSNSIGGQNVGNVDNLASLTAASTILLGDNTSMSCSEVTTLIGSLGSPPVNLNASGSSSGYPHTAIAGSNCTNP